MNTREQILEATRRIIQERGLARATTKEIAREAGYAEGTLYKHFEHKEDLFLTILQQYLPTFIDTLQEKFAGHGTLQANLQEIALATINYYEKIMPLSASFFGDTELLARHRAVMSAMQGGPQRIPERIAVYIEEEQRLSRVNQQVEALSVTMLLLGACFQYVFMRSFIGENPFAITDQQFVAGLVETLIAGLSPRA